MPNTGEDETKSRWTSLWLLNSFKFNLFLLMDMFWFSRRQNNKSWWNINISPEQALKKRERERERHARLLGHEKKHVFFFDLYNLNYNLCYRHEPAPYAKPDCYLANHDSCSDQVVPGGLSEVIEKEKFSQAAWLHISATILPSLTHSSQGT